jgi:hypothetical protein
VSTVLDFLMTKQGDAPGDPVVGRARIPARPPGSPEEEHPAAPNLVMVGGDGEPAAAPPPGHVPGVTAGAALRDWVAERPSRLAGIVSIEPPPERRMPSRTALMIMALVGVLVTGVATGAMLLTSGDPDPAAKVSEPIFQLPAPAPSPTASGAAPLPGAGDPGQTLTLSATGDIIMGAAPGGLPPNGGKAFFSRVRDALRADLQMGNLEQPLTNATGVTKCPPPPSPSPASPAPKATCFAFRSPPAYAGVLRDAGFRVLNLANNHAYDFGPEGNRQTRAALEKAGLLHTGAPGQITVAEVKGVKVAVVGFSSYAWSQSVADLDAAAALVRQAKAHADLVVVQMHIGAEGADRTHVRPGTELFLGENRGDPIRFSRAVVDAGADLVIGHGPHVMRAMEFYKGRLIAYSLGNFAGYRSLGYSGVVGVGGVLKVTLRRDGSYVSGSLVPTRMVAPGLPAPDPGRQAVSLVRSLSDADLPASGARIGDDGSVSPRA